MSDKYKTLLLYAPFCTPVTPPYSVTNLKAFLDANLDSKTHETKCIDLNAKFHVLKFPEYHEFYSTVNFEDRNEFNMNKYELKTNEYANVSKTVYSKNNKGVVNGENPEFLDELTELIKNENPNLIGLSIVYSSQAFYAHALIKRIKELKESGELKSDLKIIVGGPAVNKKLIDAVDKYLANEIELLGTVLDIEYKEADYDKLNFDTHLDFSIFDLDDYFISDVAIPIRTSSTCYYQQCAFCTHHGGGCYYEYPLEKIKKTIVASKQKYVFFVDDMIHKKRLLEIAAMMKPLNVGWVIQLRPTKELDYETLKTLQESGLKLVSWGMESASDRVLGAIRKGTNKKDISQVIKNTKKAGIKNFIYVMFGFPTETEEELIETVDFLKEHDEYIDIISLSQFGLQKGSYVYQNPEKYGIKNIKLEERTILEPKITYETTIGLTQDQVRKLKKRYMPDIKKISKYPMQMIFFREHMLALINKKE